MDTFLNNPHPPAPAGHRPAPALPNALNTDLAWASVEWGVNG